MDWLALDTLMVDGSLLDCRTRPSSYIKKHLVKRAKKKWWKRKHIAELKEGVTGLDQSGTKHVALAKSWVINGAFTQDSFQKFGWVLQNKCKICRGPGTEKHRMYEFNGWRDLRLQLVEEVKKSEQVAEDDKTLWLWERRLASLPGACLVDRAVGRKQACKIRDFGYLKTP